MNDQDQELNTQHENERIRHPLMEYYRHVYGDSKRWDGVDDLEDKKVIVYMEQGFGDIIQFFRYISLLRKSKKCHVTVAVPTELESLVSECASGWDKIHPKSNPDLPEHDYHILSMSLPFLLSEELIDKGVGHTSFPYISAKARKDLGDVEGLKVGVCWEGSPANRYNAWRSFPFCHFHKIQELWSRKSDSLVRLFSLQREIHNPELLKGAEDMELLGVEMNSFLDTAELIASLDVVVTIDSAVLHLAGAMNHKATYLLLSNAASDGRFGMDGETTRWYPKVKVIRNEFEASNVCGVPNLKDPISGWDEVFDKLVTDLEKTHWPKQQRQNVTGFTI